MPLVFVHGVNVRSDSGFREHVEARDFLFRRFALSAITPNAHQVTILNPYWGDLGATFAWHHASLPQGDFEVFGPEDELPMLLLSQFIDNRDPVRDTIILDVARNSMEDAIDLL